LFFSKKQGDFEVDMVILIFENLDTSHLSPIDGFWHIRFYVGAI
jgi:hypothetical protein